MSVGRQKIDPAVRQQIVRHALGTFAHAAHDRACRYLDQHSAAEPLHHPRLIALQGCVAFGMGQDWYQSGKLPFIAVLDALHMLHDDRVAHLSHVVDAAKWRVAIEEAKP